MTASDRVLLTGASGFVAKHVALALLNAGYTVRGTVRDKAKGEAIRKALAGAGADLARFEFVSADLLKDDGWDEAVAGCRFVQHTASPFPARQPADKFALVPAAEGGALRVIEAAKRAGVERVVMTSSVVAIYHGHENRKGGTYSEADWSRVDSPTISPYAVSKTVAEKAAWDAVADSETELAVVNPSLVLGPLLDGDAGTSLQLLSMMMRGMMPLVPKAKFGVVDVRDVAAGHLAAMRTPAANGHRFILSSEPMTLLEIGKVVRATHPGLGRRLPHGEMPSGLVKLLARFSRNAGMLANELDPDRRLDNGAARSVLGIDFRSGPDAVRAGAQSLIDHAIVRG